MLFRFPRKGLHKGLSSEEQPPETSRVLQNVRPYDTLENMARGGQRPAMRKAYTQQIGGATAPIVEIKSVKVASAYTDAAGQSQFSYTGSSNGTLNTYNTKWSTQTFTTSASIMLTAVALKLSGFTGGGTMTVSIRATDVNGKPTGADLTSGTISVDSLTATAIWLTVDLTDYVLTASTKYAIVIRTSGDVSHSTDWRSKSANPFASGDAGYSNNSGSTWTMYTDATDALFVVYGLTDWINPASGSTYASKLVTIANNEVWYESVAGTMVELAAANGGVNVAFPLTAFDAEQKLLIANTNAFRIIDFGNVKLSTTTIGTVPTKGQLLTGGLSGAKMYVDYIDASSGACNVYGWRYTLATFVNTETVTGTGGVSFVLNADEVVGPHYYAWTPYSNDSTTYGSLPLQAIGSCYYRGRMVVWGYPPNEWYMSRQLNPWDWNYLATDAGRAIYGGNSDAGKVGDIIISGIPYKDEILVWGCANSLWYLVGDPADGGSLHELDLTSGILSDRAWTWDGEENLYMLCTTGLLKVSKGFAGVENLTNGRYPNFIKDLAYNAVTQRLTLTFDRINKGILICKTTPTTGASVAWWYDLRTGGLFPETYPNNCGIMCSLYYEAVDPTYRKTLYGCVDGYIREFDPTQEDDQLADDSEQAIDSYAGIGPFPLGTIPDGKGVLSNVRATLGGGDSGGTEDSDAVTYQVYVEDTAEEVNKQMTAIGTPILGGTFSTAVQGHRSPRKALGCYAGILLRNNTLGQAWAMEKVVADIRPTNGKVK